MNVQLEELPEVSVAVLVTVVTPIGKTLPEGGLLTTVTIEEQLSVAVTLKLTTAPHWPLNAATWVSAGQVITGAVVSITVTLKVHVAVLPDESVATLVTVVVPTGKVLPDAGVDTTVAEQLSVAITLKLTTAPQILEAEKTLVSAGQIITGGVVSITVTVNEQVDVLFELSVAVNVTKVVPTGNEDPDEGPAVWVALKGVL